MIIIKQRRSHKGSVYWIREHVDEHLLSDNGEDEICNFLELFSDNRIENEFEEIFVRDEVEKVLRAKGLGDLGVKIAFLLMDGWTKAEIARMLKLPYDRVNYIFKKIRKILASLYNVTCRNLTWSKTCTATKAVVSKSKIR